MSKQKKGKKRKNNSPTRLSEKRRAMQKAIDEERIANFIDFFGDIDFEYTGSAFLFFKDETTMSAISAHLFEKENMQNGRLATALLNQIQVSGDDLI